MLHRERKERKYLDGNLANVLGLKVSEESGELEDINDHEYILTQDFLCKVSIFFRPGLCLLLRCTQ